MAAPKPSEERGLRAKIRSDTARAPTCLGRAAERPGELAMGHTLTHF